MSEKPRWNSKGPDANKIRAMFASGEINEATKPGEVYDNHGEFQKYEITQFRPGFNRVKKDFYEKKRGINDVTGSKTGTTSSILDLLDDDDDDDEIINNIIAQGMTQNKKAKTNNVLTPDEKSSMIMYKERVGEPQELFWSPMQLQATWKDSEMTEHVSVIVILPAGIAKSSTKNIIDVQITNSGKELSIKVKWPKFVCNVEALHKSWLNEQKTGGSQGRDVLNRLQAFSALLSTLRSSEKEILRSVAHIPLLITVSKKIHFTRLLADRNDEARVFYVDLKAEESNYKGLDVAYVNYGDEVEVENTENE